MEAVATLWKIDAAHSELGFKVKHMMISSVSGVFNEFEASVTSEDEHFQDAQINLSIKTASISTNNGSRDKHLKSNDFFNVDKFPEIKFISTSYRNNKLQGDLTIKDVTKSIELEVDFNGIAVDPYGRTKAGFEVLGKINRKDFDLTWNAVTETGSIVVADEVLLVINVQLIKQ